MKDSLLCNNTVTAINYCSIIKKLLQIVMPSNNFAELLQRVDQFESQFCVAINRSSHRAYIRYFFRVISRLGDGVFWYSLALCLPYLNGYIGWLQALHVLVTGLVCLIVYKYLKSRLVRERPFISCDIIYQAAPALDRYSFPSGHTLHAVMFSVLFSLYLPHLSSMVWGFTCLVALSRIVLGLHYPSDVLAGALLGLTIAVVSSSLITI